MKLSYEKSQGTSIYYIFDDNVVIGTADTEKSARKMCSAVNSHDKLVEALRKISNEVEALKPFEGELRAELGNTNYNCLMLRLKEARAALEGLE